MAATAFAQPTIKAQGVGVLYRQRQVLKNVTISFEPGRITALIGPSGCGKTSFLNVINRMTDLIPGCQVEGKVTFDGQDIHHREMDLRQLRRRVGMIFQKANPFPFSIRKNLELPLRERGIVNRSEIEGRIEFCLNQVGLWSDLKDRLGGSALELSGGQQQRLCLARALTMEPEVLLMDEPCSALDPISGGLVEELIVGFRHRITIVIVTHNLFQAKRIADDLAMFWVDDGIGTLIESGPCAKLMNEPRHPTTAAYMSGLKG